MWQRRLLADRREREAHFVAIHFLAVEARQEADSDGPTDYETLLESWGGPNSELGRPFVEGLDYEPLNGAFSLAEPNPRRVTLLRSDRLIATDQNWPRWEQSGEYARKFPEQDVPPLGFQ
ncbi:hypothetical protein HNR46_003392 [Haloferula luteola]|uniref:Uncharacterized protein n=1 Tax=Haloferula luteola TaxID=595692 RepID=A0A840VH40_9BACT|nr:hypothetical protein [Haloferula luteola]